jgi:hypothetical protein
VDTAKYYEAEEKRSLKLRKALCVDELVILPGVAMSAADVVRALRRYIAEVEQNGMYIGRYKDAIIIEKINGSLEAYSQKSSQARPS